ncbi:hypothetical protein VN12_23600 [Pirellula sp. SH-Sr6A]|uniref:hypothetical protein n=1 Tax=Pirellula sp. SH-Sr6A TaxID=1632865 RepID=UPI00078BDE1D|nr:hypothetical protein [Pirellula sp. SH-Sr6A]AMV35131.1 hypothetical protein VN12_23600 [Pirellula sp. SH-Sr6A]
MHQSPYRFFFQSTVTLGSMLGISSFLFVQDPPSAPTQPSSSQPSPSLSPTTPPVDLDNDPVFQEIKKAFMPREGVPTQPQTPSSRSISDIPDAQWHAVEHLLRGARDLESIEREHMKKGNGDQASRARLWIQQIRSTARSLLAD